MEKSYCERDELGREVGVIVHEGHEFKALGATVQGRYVTGYLGKRDELKTWCGRTMLDCRSERFGSYYAENWGDTFGIIYHLTRGRAIVGYALGEGMLFRGVLVDIEDIDEARDLCECECASWIDIDEEDARRFQEELDAEEEDAQ